MATSKKFYAIFQEADCPDEESPFLLAVYSSEKERQEAWDILHVPYNPELRPSTYYKEDLDINPKAIRYGQYILVKMYNLTGRKWDVNYRFCNMFERDFVDTGTLENYVCPTILQYHYLVEKADRKLSPDEIKAKAIMTASDLLCQLKAGQER